MSYERPASLSDACRDTIGSLAVVLRVRESDYHNLLSSSESCCFINHYFSFTERESFNDLRTSSDEEDSH